MWRRALLDGQGGYLTDQLVFSSAGSTQSLGGTGVVFHFLGNTFLSPAPGCCGWRAWWPW